MVPDRQVVVRSAEQSKKRLFELSQPCWEGEEEGTPYMLFNFISACVISQSSAKSSQSCHCQLLVCVCVCVLDSLLTTLNWTCLYNCNITHVLCRESERGRCGTRRRFSGRRKIAFPVSLIISLTKCD